MQRSETHSELKDSSGSSCQGQLGSTLPVCFGDRSSIRGFMDFSREAGIEEEFLIGFGMLTKCLSFKVATCPGLSGTAVDDACWVSMINK